MTVKELKEYLSRWPEDKNVSFLAVQREERIAWPCDQIGVLAITDSKIPVIGIMLYESEPMDEEMIQAMEEDKAAVGWIPVAERMPERNKSVLLCMKSRSSRTGMCIQTGSYDNGFWFIQGAAGYESLATFEFRVLAWMPLPEPYREE